VFFKTRKARYWDEKKGISPEMQLLPKKELPKSKPKILEGLRGVLDARNEIIVNENEVNKNATNAVVEYILTSVQVETDDYKKCKSELDKMNQFVNDLNGKITFCNEQINRTKSANINFLPAAGITAGGLIGNKKTEGNILGTALGGTLGWGLGKLMDVAFFEEGREKQKKQQIAQYEKDKTELQRVISQMKSIILSTKTILNQLNRYETKQIKKVNLKSKFSAVFSKNELTDAKGLQPLNGNILETTINADQAGVQTNNRIITSKELKEMDYKCLNFQNKWKELFGLPAVIFHAVVHGKPGEGKSTFCIQFANYLAENFGNVVYISGEEGFSKTLRDKVVLTRAESPFLFFSNLNSFDEIKEKIENKFHFIFIDSLDTLRIDSIKLKELRERFPNSAFITISQSTKDGKMRGSQEIVHDADIALIVQDRMAITTKNRFKEKGARFNVFPSYSKKEE
jgi:hypothetical protein